MHLNLILFHPYFLHHSTTLQGVCQCWSCPVFLLPLHIPFNTLSTPPSKKKYKTISKPSIPSSSQIPLLTHTSKPQDILPMIPPSFQHPSRCVSMLILPNISATLMKSLNLTLACYPCSFSSFKTWTIILHILFLLLSPFHYPIKIFEHTFLWSWLIMTYLSHRSTIQVQGAWALSKILKF